MPCFRDKCWFMLPDEVDIVKLVTLLMWHCCCPDFWLDSRQGEEHYRRISSTTRLSLTRHRAPTYCQHRAFTLPCCFLFSCFTFMVSSATSCFSCRVKVDTLTLRLVLGWQTAAVFYNFTKTARLLNNVRQSRDIWRHSPSCKNITSEMRQSVRIIQFMLIGSRQKLYAKFDELCYFLF